MTVENTTLKIQYTGDGSQVKFPFPFTIYTSNDLQVIITDANGTETTQVLDTDFTIPSSAGFADGSNIEMTTAPAATETLTIKRVLTLTQSTNYVENDPFPANSHERALDRLVMIDQQTNETLDRSIKFPVSDSSTINTELPGASSRASNFLGFDANGGVIAATSISASPVSSFWNTILEYTDAATSRVGLSAAYSYDLTNRYRILEDSLTTKVEDVDGQLASHVSSAGYHYLESSIDIGNISVSAHDHPKLNDSWVYSPQTATTTGTEVELLTNMPSDVLEIEVMLNAVGTNTNSQPPILRLNHQASGYIDGINIDTGGGGGIQNDTDGFHSIFDTQYVSSETVMSIFRLSRWDASEHIWYCTHNGTESGSYYSQAGGGHVTLTSALSACILTTPGGVATFDAGEARVRYR